MPKDAPKPAAPTALRVLPDSELGVADCLLTPAQVLQLTHLGPKRRNAMERRGEFPRRRWVGQQRLWLASEVTAWMRQLPAGGVGEPIIPPAVTSAARRLAEELKAQERKARSGP